MRNKEIDITKGIGIIFVIALHSDFHMDWMISFEMPLFFLLSGCFFNCSMPFRQFFIKKVNTLLVPYCFFKLPQVLYSIGYALIHSNMASMKNSVIPTATWFLLSLFETQLIAYPVIRYTKGKMILFIGLLLSITGYIASQYHIANVLFVNTTLTCSFYFILGYLLRKQINRVTAYKSITYCALMMGGFLLCYLLWTIHKPYIFYRDNLMPDNYFLVVLMALTGCFAVLNASRLIKRNSVLEFYGRYSLIVLGTHLYCIFFLECLPLECPHWLVFIICVLMEVPIICLMKRLFPRMCGLKPLFLQFNKII